MKGVLLVTLLAGLLANSACTTLQPTEASPEEIQRLILTEGLLEPGQKVRLVTADEAVHEFRITDIDREKARIDGNNESVQVIDIIALETHEVSIGKTALLTGGLTYGIGILIAIAIAPALILGGG